MNLTWANERRRLRELVAWEHNPRQIGKAQASRLADSLEQFGQIHAIAIGPDGEIYDGHQRTNVWAAVDKFGPDYEVDVRVASRPLTEAERRKLVTYLHSGTTGDWDWDALSGWDVGELVTWGFDAEQVAAWDNDAANLRTMIEAEVADAAEVDEEPEAPRAYYVPDAIFPSDNDWDVPTLDLAMQADFLELPLTKWGDGSRKARMRGTYHFYTEDYKFEALWADPLDLVNSGCVAIVEPNSSTNDQMPAVVGLWRVYRKRWLARYMQEFGVKVWVDLNVTAKFAEMNLLGVPQGWRSYCTRGLDRTIDDLEGEYAIACDRAAPEPPRFLVYGGGKATEALCKARGWQWLPENMRVKEGKAEADYG